MCNYSVIKYCSAYESNSRVTLTEESGRCVIFEKNECSIRVLESHTDDFDSKFLFNCYGVLGSISFMSRSYLVLVTEATKCGRLLLEHDVYSIKSQKLIPLFHPASLSSEEREFVRVFKDFDISNNFYFSYTYNLSNSLQLNLSYKLHMSEGGKANSDRDWMIFDPVLMHQKYCYNFSHKMDLCKINEGCFNLSLVVVHGYFSESVLNVSGRNMTFSLISRRSRFFSGTRYRKRGIIGSGYVANDVETEQILHDWGVTSSVSSFVLMRGSTPIFWSQDPNDSFLIKPPIIYPHSDPTNSSVRSHFKQLLSCYGAPIVALNLLSDNQYTEEGHLSERYKTVVEELNSELPTFLKILYFSKNIKSMLEKGVAKQMLKEVVDLVLENIKLLYIPMFRGTSGSFSVDVSNASMDRSVSLTSGSTIMLSDTDNATGNSSIDSHGSTTNCSGLCFSSEMRNGTSRNKNLITQTGIIRVSCLDCLDRTSAFSKHLSLRIFKHQLELIGIRINYEQSTCLIASYMPKQVAFHTPRDNIRGSEVGSDLTSSLSSFEENAISYREEGIIASDYFGFNQVKGLLFEVIKDRYEQMCDELSMQYAGSKALRKYEGKSRVMNMPLELFTTVRRRYRNFFEDTKIQEQTNFFLYTNFLSYYSQIGINIIKNDLDDLIHFKPIPIEFNNTDAFILALVVYNSRVGSLKSQRVGRESIGRFSMSDSLDALSVSAVQNCSVALDSECGLDSVEHGTLGAWLGSPHELGSCELNEEAEKLYNLNPITGDFHYTVYSNYLNLVFNRSCDMSKLHTKVKKGNFNSNVMDNTSFNIYASSYDGSDTNTSTDLSKTNVSNGSFECCSIHDEVEVKKKALRMILTNYLTIQDQSDVDYTDLSSYKPSDKIINLMNTEPTPECSSELTMRSSITNQSAYSDIRRDVDGITQSSERLSLKENSKDYTDFLMPIYTYNKDHWSLEPNCNIEPLTRFITITI